MPPMLMIRAGAAAMRLSVCASLQEGEGRWRTSGINVAWE
jgi:hypothetical protein